MIGETTRQRLLARIAPMVGEWTVRQTQIIFAGPGVVQIVTRDPTRWAVGFSLTGGGVFLSTVPDVLDDGGYLLNAGLIDWHKWSDVGAFSTLDWYASPLVGTVEMTVWEALIP